MGENQLVDDVISVACAGGDERPITRNASRPEDGRMHEADLQAGRQARLCSHW